MATTDTTDSELRDIVVDAYIYLYPLVLMEATRRVVTNVARAGQTPGRAPVNTVTHIREFPRADYRDVVRPNFDTLYSAAWFDLSREPIILSAPDTSGPNGRYYLLPLLDMWSNVFAAIGTRTSGRGAADFALLPPGWTGTLPAGVRAIPTPTPTVWMIGRTQTNSPTDYANVHRQQDGYRATPLSRWGQAPTEVTGSVDPGVDMKTPPMTAVDNMAGPEFFRRGLQLMAAHPAGAYDWPIMARMARAGLVAGSGFDPAALPAATRAAIEQAPGAAQALIRSAGPSVATLRNNWRMLVNNIGAYGTGYLARAHVALVGLGANLPEDAIYPLATVDSEGRPLVGEHRYTLTFAPGQEPPVNAFWSLTMYDAEGFQVANPIDRFAIGDRDGLLRGADGSIELLIQHADPGGDRRRNWLPAPAQGRMEPTLRLYWPKASAADGRWMPPMFKRLD
jgi:hypothetical protein